jgi:hypothetical protein
MRYTVPGDANLDGQVTFPDLVALAQNYNTIATGQWQSGDFNYDGDINFADLVILAQHYNAALPASPLLSVPEPTAAGLLLLPLALASRRPRRRKPPNVNRIGGCQCNLNGLLRPESAG